MATSAYAANYDKTKYSGTQTAYFEIVAYSDVSLAFTVSLIGDTDGSVVTINVPTLTTAPTLFRSSSFDPTTSKQDYRVQISNAIGTNKRVKAARIVIIQSGSPIATTETQIEVGNASTTTTTTDTPLTNPKYWKYTAANWDGTITMYFEGTFATGTSKSAATLTLQTSSSITAPSWSNVADTGITTTSTSSVPATVRSATAFTPTNGNWYRVVMKAGNSKSGITVYNAKVIIDQVGTTSQVTYYFDGSDAAVTDPDAVWSNDTNLTNGDTATGATTSNTGSKSSNYLQTEGTNAVDDGTVIKTVEARVHGKAFASSSTAYGSYVTLSTPSGGWSWTKIQALETRVWADFTANDISAEIYVDGDVGGTALGNPQTQDGGSGAFGWTVDQIELRVTYYSSGNPTLVEPQYLLANTLFAAGTGLQTFLTQWDSTEWTGVTNTYYFQAEAADNSTSDVTLEEADGGGTVTNSTVTNVDNAQISSAMTMPTNQNLDTKATTNAGDVAAARILVAVVITVTPPIPNKIYKYLQAINRSNTY